MPKPSPIWIAEESLDSYVYVLLHDYMPWGHGDSSPLFYARIGDGMFTIDKSEVYDFLIRHGDCTFITYDAVAFHAACLAAVGDDEKQAVWDLSRQFRLWDLALLEMRIHYAFTGTVKKVEKAKGLEWLVTERCPANIPPSGPPELLGCLRSILQNQIQWALDNLPLFHTFRDEQNIPAPVTVDEYEGVFCKPFLPSVRTLIREVGLTPNVLVARKNDVEKVLKKASRSRLSTETTTGLLKRASDSIGTRQGNEVINAQFRLIADYLDFTEGQIASINEVIRQRMSVLDSPVISLGIGPEVAATILAESGDIARFPGPANTRRFAVLTRASAIRVIVFVASLTSANAARRCCVGRCTCRLKRS